MKRRQFTKLACLGAGLVPLLSGCESAVKSSPLASKAAVVRKDLSLKKAEAEAFALKTHQEFMTVKDFKMEGNEQIAMLLYPKFTALDLVGPQFLFASLMGAKIYLVSPTDDLTPVMSDTGLAIVPTHTQSECPDNLDLLFLPGGATGTLKAMQNPQFIDFIKTKAATAKYVTSVCTGSLLLGKAGLLKGKKATSHWVTLDLLSNFGATPVKDRVVWDGNVITGAGVTAGLDFGLEVLAALRGKAYAQATQLQVEYDPQPPFDSGSPDKADVRIKNALQGMFAPLHVELEAEI